MEIRTKEIDMLESAVPDMRTKITKLDVTASTLSLLALLLYLTTPLDSVIKLPILGIQLRTDFTIYVVFLLSLLKVQQYLINSIHLIELTDRYKALLSEEFGETPQAFNLIYRSEYELKKNIFSKNFTKTHKALDNIYHVSFILGSVWLTYKLLLSATSSTFTIAVSIFIVVSWVYIALLFIQYVRFNLQLASEPQS
ncbi:hypothetical protein FCV62_21315 [Vibrio kanaloae]|uniref:hypothetical protein n=1 Tax=Vibrio kanaloae TaxID=170673 RepID=UPI0010BF3518|nr:hypothetical protein [Vibrio kanaloae]TKF74549.1 hypothetical protein FCV62_21315 [Vibrio kanaloae]